MAGVSKWVRAVERGLRGVWRYRVLVPLGAVGGLLLIAVAAWAWIEVPQLYPPYLPATGAPPLTPEVAATRDATRAQSIVTTRASVLAALAGLGALITIFINFRNSELAAHALSTTQETFRITERGHLTDRYTKAIEQLGHKDSIAIRLGGIYALQQLAVDTNRDSDQATVVEVLSAFVRLNLRVAPPAQDSNSTSTESASEPVNRVLLPRADVLAAFSVLAQLPVRTGVPMRAEFTGLDFTDIDLQQARLAGANLSGVTLRGARLTRADISGSNLAGAFLKEAQLGRAKLADSILCETNFVRAFLRNADLTRAQLNNANLGDADLARANLRRSNLTGADLTDVDLTSANLTSADLTGADLRGADLTDAVIVGTNLTGANLSETNFTGANLSDADLSGADLTGATVTEKELAQATGIPHKRHCG